VVSPAKRGLIGLILACVSGCAPKFSDRFSDVNGPRVLAVRSAPAEGAPKAAVAYSLLVVDESGPVTSPSVAWSYCSESKPTNELNDVASACFGTNDQVTLFGSGTSPSTKLPFDSCAQFGPDLPHVMPGQPQGRPADPDATGGYYQPVILHVTADATPIPTLGETRLTCGLANSTGDQAQEYRVRTHPNENPTLGPVTLPEMADTELRADETTTTTLSTGKTVKLRASWPECPAEPACGDGICSPGEAIQDCPDDCTMPKGCGGSEPYAYLDPASHELVERHESMRVSWFANAGTFGSDHTGQLESAYTVVTSDNTWTAPSESGPVFMWVVLRDDRGGVDWKSFRIDIQ
jgi:hypothetical protein